MTHTDPKPLGGEQYSTPGTSLPAANSPASDERLTQTPEVAVEQNEPGNPGQAVVIQGAPVVPEGAMTVQRAPGSEDGQEGDARALPLVNAGLSRREGERRADIVLQLVGLGDRVHHKPAELSGGQQQRVAIARALINGPALLLADEPTGNLDSHTSVEIMGVLQALNEQGLNIVLVTSDPTTAQYASWL